MTSKNHSQYSLALKRNFTQLCIKNSNLSKLKRIKNDIYYTIGSYPWPAFIVKNVFSNPFLTLRSAIFRFNRFGYIIEDREADPYIQKLIGSKNSSFFKKLQVFGLFPRMSPMRAATSKKEPRFEFLRSENPWEVRKSEDFASKDGSLLLTEQLNKLIKLSDFEILRIMLLGPLLGDKESKVRNPSPRVDRFQSVSDQFLKPSNSTRGSCSFATFLNIFLSKNGKKQFFKFLTKKGTFQWVYKKKCAAN